MPVSQVRHLTTARGTLQEALLDKERLIDILYGSGILTQCRGNCPQTHRTTLELVNDCCQDAVVYLVQAVLVYVECLKCDIRDGKGDSA